MKINFVVGHLLCPAIVDDFKIKHEAVLLIETEDRENRYILGLTRDKKLSRPYLPYWHRVCSLDKLTELRDHLTKIIDEYQ